MKSISKEELRRGIRGKGRQIGSSYETGDREEEMDGEEFALQVMRVEPNPFQIQDIAFAMRGTNEDGIDNQGNSAGFEPIVQEASMEIGQSVNTEIGNTMNLMNFMGVNLANQFSTMQEPFFQFNANREWANTNFWNSSMFPADGGSNSFFSGIQQFSAEQTLTIKVIQ